MRAVRIGIVGDFDREKRSHWATEAASFHAAAQLGIGVEPRWISSTTLTETGCARSLSEVDGVWGAPGSPFVSPHGVLAAIRHARERDIPYIGTCAGFQYGLIEFTRNVLGIPDADTAENAPDGKNIVITPIECAVPSRSGPAMNGLSVAHPVAGTMLHSLCGTGELREEYFCNFSTNADYVPRWEAAGLKVAARGEGGEVRAFELPTRRFFVATLFQPQLSSSFDRPHPIVSGFLRACAGASESK